MSGRILLDNKAKKLKKTSSECRKGASLTTNKKKIIGGEDITKFLQYFDYRTASVEAKGSHFCFVIVNLLKMIHQVL
jgi:hypothetical protein